MNYFLIKLRFDTAVHFGPSDSAQSLSASEDHFCADTLFSALCHTALQLEGEEGLHRLLDWVREGSLLLSDSMPWRGEDCYLPKPCYAASVKSELSAEQRKAVKKMAWLPIRDFPAFSDSVHGGAPYAAQTGGSFGCSIETTRAAVSEGADAVPYRVGVYRFAEDCGLYLLLAAGAMDQAQTVLGLLRNLGLSGIGGKVSSGCGRFHLVQTSLLNEAADRQGKWLYTALTRRDGLGLLLSASLPREAELESAMDGAAYQLVRRSGFVASDTYAPSPMKKQTQYYFKAGSTFRNRYEGDLYLVGKAGAHPVYRYGKPLFLGVEL